MGKNSDRCGNELPLFFCVGISIQNLVTFMRLLWQSGKVFHTTTEGVAVLRSCSAAVEETVLRCCGPPRGQVEVEVEGIREIKREE
jgi:hypothetical protein